MTNRRRAVAAGIALNAFTLEAYGGRDVVALHPDDVFTAVGDLIADLGHFLRLYAQQQKVNDPGAWTLDGVVDAASYHYVEEEVLGWDDEG